MWKSVTKKLSELLGKKEKRELLCEECDREYQIWWTDNALWNKVCGIDGKNIGSTSFLCMDCFANRHGNGMWELKLDEIHEIKH